MNLFSSLREHVVNEKNSPMARIYLPAKGRPILQFRRPEREDKSRGARKKMCTIKSREKILGRGP
jgi:hypothetical protein